MLELAWFDVKMRYARSVLGPFWITLSMIILIGGLSFVFVSLWAIPLQRTMPWIALGIIIWNYISTYLDEACGLFIDGRILNMRISPLKMIVINIFKHLIILLHNSVVIIAVIIFFDLKITANYFYLIFSFIIIIIN